MDTKANRRNSVRCTNANVTKIVTMIKNVTMVRAKICAYNRVPVALMLSVACRIGMLSVRVRPAISEILDRNVYHKYRVLAPEIRAVIMHVVAMLSAVSNAVVHRVVSAIPERDAYAVTI